MSTLELAEGLLVGTQPRCMVAIKHLFVLWCGADVAGPFLASLPHFLSLTPSLCYFMGGVAQCRKCLGRNTAGP